MTRYFRVSESDCLEIAGSQHRLLSSERAGTIWSRLDDPSVCLSFTGDEFVQVLSQPDVRLRRGTFSDEAAFRRLRCDVNYLQTIDPIRRAKALWQASCAKFFLESEARGETNRSV